MGPLERRNRPGPAAVFVDPAQVGEGKAAVTPAWGWLTIALGNLLPITGYDLWLHFTHRHTLTRQMVDWLRSPTFGPLIIAGAAFLLVLGALHFLRYHPAGP